MTEPLLTVEDFQEMFSEIDTPTPEKQLKRPLGVALRRIKSWVGEEVYEQAVAADEADDCKNDLQCAAGYLAMHFLIANFNTVVSVGGIMKTNRDQAGATIAYLTPDETAKRSQEFFDLAEEMALPWKADVETATIETVYDER